MVHVLETAMAILVASGSPFLAFGLLNYADETTNLPTHLVQDRSASSLATVERLSEGIERKKRMVEDNSPLTSNLQRSRSQFISTKRQELSSQARTWKLSYFPNHDLLSAFTAGSNHINGRLKVERMKAQAIVPVPITVCGQKVIVQDAKNLAATEVLQTLASHPEKQTMSMSTDFERRKITSTRNGVPGLAGGAVVEEKEEWLFWKAIYLIGSINHKLMLMGPDFEKRRIFEGSVEVMKDGTKLSGKQMSCKLLFQPSGEHQKIKLMAGYGEGIGQGLQDPEVVNQNDLVKAEVGKAVVREYWSPKQCVGITKVSMEWIHRSYKPEHNEEVLTLEKYFARIERFVAPKAWLTTAMQGMLRWNEEEDRPSSDVVPLSDHTTLNSTLEALGWFLRSYLNAVRPGFCRDYMARKTRVAQAALVEIGIHSGYERCQLLGLIERYEHTFHPMAVQQGTQQLVKKTTEAHNHYYRKQAHAIHNTQENLRRLARFSTLVLCNNIAIMYQVFTPTNYSNLVHLKQKLCTMMSYLRPMWHLLLDGESEPESKQETDGGPYQAKNCFLEKDFLNKFRFGVDDGPFSGAYLISKKLLYQWISHEAGALFKVPPDSEKKGLLERMGTFLLDLSVIDWIERNLVKYPSSSSTPTA